MNVLFVATEVAPYYRTGGLADIVYGLAKELCVQGHDARIVAPRYRATRYATPVGNVVDDLKVPLGAYSRNAHLWKTGGGPIVYLVDQNFYFGRDDFYGYADDYERFIFFTRAALEMLISPGYRAAENDWFPEIIQGFDWATGLIPGWLPHYRRTDKRFDAIRFALFVHNIRRLGKFGSRALSLAEQGAKGFYPEIGEATDRINFLGRGLLFADQVVMANPDFNQQDNPLPETAEVLRGVVERRRADGSLHGIVSRIDAAQWNPATDTALNQVFSDQTLVNRVGNKLALQAWLGFRQDKDIPLLGMVNRLIPENGFELLAVLEKRRAEFGEVQLVILAEPGDTDYQDTVRQWEADQDHHRPWIKSRFMFDDNLARMIYAGCDVYLLPAKEHPGGINQLIAMRYGALPVARHTGAIAKTVFGYEPGIVLWRDVPDGMGIGFKFQAFSETEFLQALKTALDVYRQNQTLWGQMQLHNMRGRLTWDLPVGDYLDLYAKTRALPQRAIVAGKALELNAESRLLQALQELGNIPFAGGVPDILREAARLVRWILSCDVVYVSGLDKRAQLSAGDSRTREPWTFEFAADEDRRREPPDEKQVSTLLNQSSNNTWRHLGDVDMEGVCRTIKGLESSALAQSEGWTAGWSAPVLAQGRLLGSIDALFTNPPPDKPWVVSSLASLANAIGLRLDTVRILNETETVSAMGRDLIGAESVQDAIDKACAWAGTLIPGSHAWVYLVRNGDLDSRGASAEPSSAEKLARRVLESRQVVYVADWHEAPRLADGRREYRSVLAIPIAPPLSAAGAGGIKGVLMVVSAQHAAFTCDDEYVLANHLSPQIFATLQRAHGTSAEDKRRVAQLKKLVSSLVAGVEFDELLRKVVDTIGDVLEVRAGALYLLNDETQKLEIRAAYGYQTKFLDKPFAYDVGEGLTGWIVKHGQVVTANSLKELHAHEGWKGNYNKEFDVPEPNAFLGIPLVVQEADGFSKVIGVLKVEDRKETHPRAVFDEGDVHLGEMMANVIATMVYNAQSWERRLHNFSANLSDLSDALAGSRDMPTLMDRIVERIADVLHVDAASLYLADDSGTELVIQAAAGYQEPLVEKKVKYKWGQGVTGTIAATRKPVVAQSLEELRQIGGALSGTYDEYHKGHQQPQSFYGLPLVVSDQPQAIGVLKVESTRRRFFSGEDRVLIGMMANVIATVVYNVQQSERRLHEFSVSLRELSGVLAGSRDMPTLMDNVVEKIADVLHVDAASLYLADSSATELVIQAAAGYQKPLVERKVKYAWGQGVTGTIAAKREPVQAQSLEELRRIGRSLKGTYDEYHVGQQLPQSFYGLPLIVSDQPQAIGVLKVESYKQRFFSNEDQLLIGIMANVVATVVYNAQQSEQRLREFSVSLEELSGVLAGSRDMPTLMDKIVEKIADVLHVDAASLYLADDSGTELVIQAAAGYQKPLVERKVKYKWGQGVTGTIAAKREPVMAQSLEQLRRIGRSSKGTYDGFHTEKFQPQSFYGLPLVVSEQIQAIGVLKVESRKQRFFSGQDLLLIGMMANVIATVIYNARQSERHIGNILRRLGSVSAPDQKGVPDLLRELATTTDAGVLDQFCKAIAAVLDRDPAAMEREAESLVAAHANKEIYGRISDSAVNPDVRWTFALIQSIVNSARPVSSWDELWQAAGPWMRINQSSLIPVQFSKSTLGLVEAIAGALNVGFGERGQDHTSAWFGAVINTSSVFGNTIDALPVILHREGDLDDDSLDWLRLFIQSGLGKAHPVAIWIPWDSGLTQEQLQRVQARLRSHAIDVAIASIPNVLQILQSPYPNSVEVLRGLVLRQVTLTTPFVTMGPVPDGLFFGRARELDNIPKYLRQGRSCALIGGRRIGKTSLLLRLHRVTLPALGFRSIYYDCALTRNYRELLATQITDSRPDALEGFPRTFGELFENPPSDKKLVLLLDEVDPLIEQDSSDGSPVLNRLRALANSDKIQAVLSGAASIRAASRDATSVLFNFANDIVIGPLDEHDVGTLVSTPMKALGIELIGEPELLSGIYYISGGHPNIVQRICSRLVEQANKLRIHRIALEDLEKVWASTDFRREFRETYWAEASPLEKLISLLMVEDRTLHSTRRIRERLEALLKRSVSLKTTEAALDQLVVLRSLLKESPQGHEFAVESFPVSVSDPAFLRDLIDGRLEDLG